MIGTAQADSLRGPYYNTVQPALRLSLPQDVRLSTRASYRRAGGTSSEAPRFVAGDAAIAEDAPQHRLWRDVSTAERHSDVVRCPRWAENAESTPLILPVNTTYAEGDTVCYTRSEVSHIT